MNSFISLTKRNIMLFFRSKSNMFFAALSVLILILVEVVFLGSMNTTNMQMTFPTITVNQAKWLVYSMIYASVIPIAAVTISLVCMGGMAYDKERNITSDFLVSPIKRNSLMLSYFVSSFFIGLIICVGLLIIFNIYFAIIVGHWFSALQVLYIMLDTILSLVFGNLFMLLIMSFVKNTKIIGSIGAITGTLIGFAAGAYFPLSGLPSGVGDALGLLPFAQLTALVRSAFLLNSSSILSMDSNVIVNGLNQHWGLNISVFGYQLSNIGMIFICVGFCAILLGISILRFRKMKKAD